MSAPSRSGRIVRKLLPKQAKRFLLLHVLGGRRLKDHIRQRDSRVFLDTQLLPWIAAQYSRVLFVGTAPYSYQAERLFRRRGEHLTTIDPEPGAATWGARNHIVAPIQEIAAHRPKGFFDCIVFSGVFGFGVDDLKSQRAALEALHEALAPNGLLLVGWNTNLTPDLDAMGLFEPYFVSAEDLPWPRRTSFPLPETHVYDFYRKRPG